MASGGRFNPDLADIAMNTTPTTITSITSITSITDKRRDFHRLHQAGCFALPNP